MVMLLIIILFIAIALFQSELFTLMSALLTFALCMSVYGIVLYLMFMGRS